MTAVTSLRAGTRPQRRLSPSGLVLGLLSSMAFGLSGSLARSLLETGWTPAAVVTLRMGGVFAVLLLPCLMIVRRLGLPPRRTAGRVVAYGLVAVAAAQLCYFSAVQYLSVAAALLLEYTAPVLLIGWHW